MPSPPRPLRVVSLAPAATEIVCLLGAQDWLVGRSGDCDFPPPVRSLPALSGPGPGRPDLEKLKELRPDVILTSDAGKAPSTGLPTVQEIATTFDPRPAVLSLDPQTVEDVLDEILAVGQELNLEGRAQAEVVRLRERMNSAADFVNPYEDGPNVAFLEAADPPVIGGRYIVQLLERAGARHPLNPTVPLPDSGAAVGPQQARRTAGRPVPVPPEVLSASRPDWVILCLRGLDLAHTSQAARALADQPWFRSLPALQAGQVALVDGTQMFHRPGPRLVDAFEWLVGWLQDRPELIPCGFPWQRAN